MTATPAQRRRQLWAYRLQLALADEDMKAADLHRRLEEEGLRVSRQAISQWLAGDVAPTPENQSVIAQVLGYEVHDLFPVPSADEVTS